MRSNGKLINQIPFFLFSNKNKKKTNQFFVVVVAAAQVECV